ncbi:universal stress protein [Alkalicoccus halolimnae]|uniref:Universal stress protein n=1 Tax=Alkalicoccus halolimnae TaxID=1667239 RepID=A0AAJ8LT64_9BACI|nr:universal stress protein [Alkalicoccus halolimnae]
MILFSSVKILKPFNNGGLTDVLKILLAVDGSDHSNRAAKKAIELGSLVEGASIELLYVVDGKNQRVMYFIREILKVLL